MKIRVKRNILLIILLLIPEFEPKLFTQISGLSILYILMNIVVFLFLISKLIGHKEIKISKVIWIWLLLRFYMLLVGIVNSNLTGLMQWGYLTLMISNFMLLFEFYGVQYGEKIIKYIALIAIILLAINYLTLLAFPRGIIRSTFYDAEAGDYYLLGIKTQFTTMMFPALAASSLYYIIKKNLYSKLLFLIAAIVCLLNIFNKNISTAIVGIILYLVFIVLSKIFKFRYNEWICLAVSICVQISVVIFRIQTYFGSFIEHILHKDTTMSSRVDIWNKILLIIRNQNNLKIIFGNGIFKNQEFVPFGTGFWQPHNQMIALIYPIGIIGTIFFLYFIYLLIKVKYKIPGVQELLIVCLCVMSLSVTEVYFDVSSCYIPFVLLYYYQHCFGIRKDINKQKLLQEGKYYE